MSLYELDYLSHFHAIVAACERYPHTVKLQKTGRTLTLYSINSMFYIDIQNMFCVLKELFDTTVPPAITDYIKKVVFTEAICVEDGSGAQEKELICISFIDNNTLLKFHNWLLDYYSVVNEDEHFFQKIHMSTPASRFYDADYYIHGELSGKKAGDLFSFGGWPSEEQDNIGKSASEDSGTNQYLSSPSFRPRGKHMPSRKEPSYERPFVCEYHECKRAFKRLEHLKRHQKMHTGERPYKCLFPGCHKTFSRSDNLNSHYKTHNVARRRPFPSFEYGKSFESI